MRKSIIKFLLDLVFPAVCQGCGIEDSYLCLACQNRIESPAHRCLVCGKNSLLGETHDECRRQTALAGLMVAAEYRHSAVKNLIWQLKYNSVAGIAETLALLMADFFINSDIAEHFTGSVIVPVPMHGKRQRLRGFNQAGKIGAAFAGKMGLGFAPILKRIKNTTRQVDLEKADRINNVKGIFALDTGADTAAIAGKKIIIVDDVATTGATLNECAKVLKQLNPEEIWGLVVARN